MDFTMHPDPEELFRTKYIERTYLGYMLIAL